MNHNKKGKTGNFYFAHTGNYHFALTGV